MKHLVKGTNIEGLQVTFDATHAKVIEATTVSKRTGPKPEEVETFPGTRIILAEPYTETIAVLVRETHDEMVRRIWPVPH